MWSDNYIFSLYHNRMNYVWFRFFRVFFVYPSDYDFYHKVIFTCFQIPIWLNKSLIESSIIFWSIFDKITHCFDILSRLLTEINVTASVVSHVFDSAFFEVSDRDWIVCSQNVVFFSHWWFYHCSRRNTIIDKYLLTSTN